jgi:hypothetical protein
MMSLCLISSAYYVEELKPTIEESSTHIMQGRKLKALPIALPAIQPQTNISLDIKHVYLFKFKSSPATAIAAAI